MTFAEWVSVLKDIVLAIAGIVTATVAVVTATVAVRGLNRWGVELKGKANFEAARQLAKATFKLRNDIDSFRNPLVYGGEYPAGFDWTTATDPKERATAQAHVYSNRWAPIADSLKDFEAAALEAEALWDASIRIKTLALVSCVREVNTAAQETIRAIAQAGNFWRSKEYEMEINSALTHITYGEQPNPFTARLASAIDAIEGELKRKGRLARV